MAFDTVTELAESLEKLKFGASHPVLPISVAFHLQMPCSATGSFVPAGQSQKAAVSISVAVVLKVMPPVLGFETRCARAVLTHTINIPECVYLAK